jgi:hypothetical protein
MIAYDHFPNAETHFKEPAGQKIMFDVIYRSGYTVI